MDRRDLLKTLPALAVGLAGCSGGQGTPEPTAEPTDEPTPMGTPEPTATATDSPTAEPTDEPTATESPDGTPTATGEPTPTESPTPEPTPTPQPDVEVTVAPGGSLRFEPADFTISAGDTVLWTWASAGHNIKYNDGDIPSGSDWQGTPGARTETYGSGYTHSHTFTTPGTYDYYCVPHRSAGMTASFTVE